MKKLKNSKDYKKTKENTSIKYISKEDTSIYSLDKEEIKDANNALAVIDDGRLTTDAKDLGYIRHEETDPFDPEGKLNIHYLTNKVDSIINDLYQSKSTTHRLYQYYHGIRVDSKLSELTSKDGISTPLEMDFLSLIKPRISVLLGVQKDHPMKYTIECQSKDVYYHEEEEEKLNLAKEIFNRVRKENLKVIDSFNFEHIDYFNSKKLGVDDESYVEAVKSKPIHSYLPLEDELESLIDNYNKSFKSTIHTQSDIILKKIQDKSNIDRLTMYWLKHLLISGKMYGRAKYTNKGDIPNIEALHPLSVYHPKMRDNECVSDAPQAYYIKRMSKVDILNEYGHKMTKEQRTEFFNSSFESSWINSDITWDEEIISTIHPGTITREKTYTSEYNLYCNVYEVEWIEMNYRTIHGKEVLVQELYQATRIGGPGGFYLDMGPSSNSIRNVENPFKTKLTIIGSNIPDCEIISSTMVGSLLSVQDKYDYVNMLRENLIHNVRVGGVTIDVGVLPTFLGADVIERIDKYNDNLRAGMNLVDTSQRDANNDPGGHYATKTYQSNLDAGLIQAFDLILNKYEQTASDLTGINRQMLGQFKERDGAEVSRQALAQASLQTREWFSVLDYFIEKILTSSLNLSRIALSKGQAISYTLGSKSKMFSINKNFSLYSYGVKVVDTMKEAIKLERLRSFVKPLIESSGITKEEVYRISISDSAQEVYDILLSYTADENLKKLNVTRNNAEQLQAQVEELSKELERYKKMEIDIKEREQDRKDRKLLMASIDNMEKRQLELKKLSDKEEAAKRRDEIELFEAEAGGKSKEVKNVKM